MIIVAGKFFEDAVYDVCSNDLHVCFDGKGGITNYTVISQGGSYVQRTFLNVFSNGEKITDIKQSFTKSDFAGDFVLKKGQKNFMKYTV